MSKIISRVQGRRIPAHPSFSDAAETKLRAQQRIGEISKTLETVQTVGGGKVGMRTSGKPKREILKSGGNPGRVQREIGQTAGFAIVEKSCGCGGCGDGQGHAEQSPRARPSVGTLTAVEVDEVVDRVTARWNRKEAIAAADGFAGLPAAIRDDAHDQGSDGSDVRGVFHRGACGSMGCS